MKLYRWDQSAPNVRPPCADYAPTVSRNRARVEPMGPKCAPHAPTMRLPCAHCVNKPFGLAPMGPKCAPHAPTMRPLCQSTRWTCTNGPKVRPPCAHYAPTMRPLTPQAVLKLYRWAQSAPAMRPLCARCLLPFFLLLKRWVHTAPPVRPLCYVSKPLRVKSVASIRGNAPTTTRSWRILS